MSDVLKPFWDKYTILATTLSGVLTVIPLVLIYKLQHKKQEKNITEISGYRSLFIKKQPATGDLTRHMFGVRTRINCEDKVLEYLLQFVTSATKTIDFCINHMTLTEFIVALTGRKVRGVKIRIIMDKEMIKPLYSSAYKKLSQYGFNIKVQEDLSTIMHHKFMVVDGKCPGMGKVMFGSLNFTHQALTRNFETMLQTNDKATVKRFMNTFDELWEQFEYPE